MQQDAFHFLHQTRNAPYWTACTTTSRKSTTWWTSCAGRDCASTNMRSDSPLLLWDSIEAIGESLRKATKPGGLERQAVSPRRLDYL